MTELKRCPFCGGKAKYKRTTIKTNGVWCDTVCVRCISCDSRTGRILYDARKHPNGEEYEEAAKAWNRRFIMFENIDFNALIEKATKEKCEITISYEPNRTEITIQPWKPFSYACPYKAKQEG